MIGDVVGVVGTKVGGLEGDDVGLGTISNGCIIGAVDGDDDGEFVGRAVSIHDIYYFCIYSDKLNKYKCFLTDTWKSIIFATYCSSK